MLKHLLAGALALSSFAFAAPGYHPAGPVQAPAPRQELRDDRFDAMRAEQLLRQFNAAASRADIRGMRAADSQFAFFLNEELNEARFELNQAQRSGRNGRGNAMQERRTVDRLNNIQMQFSRLNGRVDQRSVQIKRGLYEDASNIAQRELRGDRRGNRF